MVEARKTLCLLIGEWCADGVQWKCSVTWFEKSDLFRIYTAPTSMYEMP